MIIQEKDQGSRKVFYVGEPDAPLAEMFFRLPAPGRMLIEHTEVDDSLAGKGVGKQLVAHAIEYARTNRLKIIPYCPFTRSVIDRTPEYQDVLL